ncbi:unnamed protein product, partial [Protopolystoma xenopodis]
MIPGSDNVRHIMDETSARSHRGRRKVSRDLLHTIQQTEAQDNTLSLSGFFKKDFHGLPGPLVFGVFPKYFRYTSVNCVAGQGNVFSYLRSKRQELPIHQSDLSIHLPLRPDGRPGLSSALSRRNPSCKPLLSTILPSRSPTTDTGRPAGLGNMLFEETFLAAQHISEASMSLATLGQFSGTCTHSG